MAYEFGTADSKLTYARSFAPPVTLHTIMGWALFNATGSAVNPTAFNHSVSRCLVGMRNSKADLHLERTRATTLGSWRVTAANAGVAYTSWFFFAWRYDGALTTTDPTCWVGNLTTVPTARTVTEASTPVGALTTGAGVVVVGNDSTSVQDWGAGSIAWIGYYEGLATDAQVISGWRYGPSVFTGLTNHLVIPLLVNTNDISANADTAVNTTSNLVASPPNVPPMRKKALRPRTAVATPLAGSYR